MSILVHYLVPILMWGTSWFIITWQLGDTSPSLSVSMRFFSASVILFVYCYFKKKSLRFNLTDHFFILLQGLSVFGFNYLVFYIAEQYVTSGIVALIFSTIIFFNIFQANFWLKQKPTKMLLILSFTGFIGMLLVFSSDLRSYQFQSNRTLGLFLSFVGVLLASTGNILSAYNQSKKRPVIQTNAFGMLYGSIAIFVFFSLSGDPWVISLTPKYIFSFIYLTIGATILAFGSYLTLVGMIGPGKAAYVFFITPILALLLSTFFENYKWEATGLIGTIIVLVGCLLMIRENYKKKPLQKDR